MLGDVRPNFLLSPANFLMKLGDSQLSNLTRRQRCTWDAVSHFVRLILSIAGSLDEVLQVTDDGLKTAAMFAH